ILKSIKIEIRKVIKSLIDKYKEETETPEFITELFENVSKQIVNGKKGERDNNESRSETIHRKVVEEEILVSLNSESENNFVSSLNGNSSIDGGGEGKGESSNSSHQSKKKGGKSQKGGAGRGRKTPKHQIKSRIFLIGSRGDKNLYRCIVESEVDIGTADMRLAQHADSGRDVAFILHSVSDQEDQDVPFTEVKDRDGFVSEYKLTLSVAKGKRTY